MVEPLRDTKLTQRWAKGLEGGMITPTTGMAMNGKLLVIGMLTSLLGVAIYESVLVRGLSPVS